MAEEGQESLFSGSVAICVNYAFGLMVKQRLCLGNGQEWSREVRAEEAMTSPRDKVPKASTMLGKHCPASVVCCQTGQETG